MMRIASLAGVLIVALSASARAEDGPAVVPYRPSVSTPADLPAPGWPELEAGWNVAKGGDAARSLSTPLLFKLAWSEQWGILIGTDAYDWQRDFDGTTARSGGNTTVELKYKLPVSDALSLGTEIGVGLPTARPPFGSGKTDWGILGIASLDTEIAHVDVNVGGTHLGGPDEGQGRWQGNWAVDLSHSLPKGFGVTGELSGIVQHGTRAQSQLLAALTYNVSRQLVLDFGVVAGLSGAAPHWQILGGLTVQLGHWFLDGAAATR